MPKTSKTCTRTDYCFLRENHPWECQKRPEIPTYDHHPNCLHQNEPHYGKCLLFEHKEGCIYSEGRHWGACTTPESIRQQKEWEHKRAQRDRPGCTLYHGHSGECVTRQQLEYERQVENGRAERIRWRRHQEWARKYGDAEDRILAGVE